MRQSSLWWVYIFLFSTEGMALVCDSYDPKCLIPASATGSKNSTCSSIQECDHTPGAGTPACYALFGRNKAGELNVMMKGCISKVGKDCAPASVCSGQQKSFRKLQPLYYCCCTEDRCNHEVVMSISEETEKNCTVEDINESIRNLTLLIWANLITMMIILVLIAIAMMAWKLISCKRRRETSTNVKRLSQVVCDKGTHQYHNTSHWKKQDFQLITCLVRSTYGEIWQARLHGSNRVVRIRLSAGSDDVYVYDKQVMVKNTNVIYNTTRVV